MANNKPNSDSGFNRGPQQLRLNGASFSPLRYSSKHLVEIWNLELNLFLDLELNLEPGTRNLKPERRERLSVASP